MTDITIGFTPTALEKYPALADVRRRPGAGFAMALPHLRRGDQVALQGVPAPENFVVACRLWEVMDDEASLTILLGLCSEVPY